MTSGRYLGAQATSVGSLFFFSSRRRHTRFDCDWSSDVCSSDLLEPHCFVPDFGWGKDIGTDVLVGTGKERDIRHKAVGLEAAPVEAEVADNEIGRASCRERV